MQTWEQWWCKCADLVGDDVDNKGKNMTMMSGALTLLFKSVNSSTSLAAGHSVPVDDLSLTNFMLSLQHKSEPLPAPFGVDKCDLIFQLSRRMQRRVTDLKNLYSCSSAHGSSYQSERNIVEGPVASFDVQLQ